MSELLRVVQPEVRGESCSGARNYLEIIIFIAIQRYKMLPKFNYRAQSLGVLLMFSVAGGTGKCFARDVGTRGKGG
jgi:hypothetical protein